MLIFHFTTKFSVEFTKTFSVVILNICRFYFGSYIFSYFFIDSWFIDPVSKTIFFVYTCCFVRFTDSAFMIWSTLLSTCMENRENSTTTTTTTTTQQQHRKNARPFSILHRYFIKLLCIYMHIYSIVVEVCLHVSQSRMGSLIVTSKEWTKKPKPNQTKPNAIDVYAYMYVCIICALFLYQIPC